MERLIARVRQHLFVYYYAAAFVATLGWILFFNIEFSAAATPSGFPDTKQHVLSDGVFSVFDERGKPLYNIKVNNVNYLPDGEEFGFNATDIRYETDSGHLAIRSNTGRFILHNEALVFDDKVRVRRMVGGRMQEELNTSALTVMSKENIARSDEYAEIKRGGGVITGTGIEINLVNGNLKLLKNVRLKS